MTIHIATLWPDRRTLWRWHFFAGLFCLPFVAFLSLTGAVYLFKPQIDDWIDWRYDHLLTVQSPSPKRDVQAALSAVPQGAFLAYELPRTSQSAARILVSRPEGEAVRVYVDRNTHTVLKTVLEENRFERLVFRLHGQLLLGNMGSVIMEMVASWTIVLIVTGLLLWWPRGQNGLAGVVYPRLGIKGRTRWRDLHAVTGVWASVFLVLFLVSGLPWSFVWGHTLQSVENTVGRLTSVKDWEIGAVPAATVIAGHPVGQSQKQPATGSMDMPGMDMPTVSTSFPEEDLVSSLDTVVQTASTLSLPAPVIITPSGSMWTVRSDTQNRPLRESVTVTPDGHVQAHITFAQKGLIDRIIGYGVAAHEGQLFGKMNQAINFLVATGLLMMSSAATVLWLKRKPVGTLGVPPAMPSQRYGIVGIMTLVILGLLLPELGAALLVLTLANRMFAR
ncbi:MULTISPECIES: PepSY domain-containing protein [Acetobacter]|uniref:Peptidase n=1 Tax=Acetobacter pomorum TaxID=65959 RepID=A0AAN1PKE0_9PROT|nr:MULTISPECIES: PepSY domain-containing protein [Acetobacter]AXN01831.1 peptidase [Acetobacter pomorum]KAA8390578.1 PepSY domain-containing protein [Acetobacter sp. DmW_125124]KAA8394251.1 PepSY domain-containing protein [Acetobacter sp. DmW_125128]KAA8395315.1 PepSY domain-containing protein [Acetobacter sp. DmW_125127]KAA8403205.1 PepSY domain-containing protein [Acetobacter sp. DmW_125132]